MLKGKLRLIMDHRISLRALWCSWSMYMAALPALSALEWLFQGLAHHALPSSVRSSLQENRDHHETSEKPINAYVSVGRMGASGHTNQKALALLQSWQRCSFPW